MKFNNAKTKYFFLIFSTISGLSIIQASPTGGCAGTNPKVISFGQNVQSTCLFT
jgi:hypothetical protein